MEKYNFPRVLEPFLLLQLFLYFFFFVNELKPSVKSKNRKCKNVQKVNVYILSSEMK